MSDELWARGITAEGGEATVDQMREAWRMWMKRGLKTQADLEGLLSGQGVPYFGRPATHGRMQGRPAARIADRMLQRARKAGVIRFVKGRWERTDA